MLVLFWKEGKKERKFRTCHLAMLTQTKLYLTGHSAPPQHECLEQWTVKPFKLTYGFQHDESRPNGSTRLFKFKDGGANLEACVRTIATTIRHQVSTMYTKSRRVGGTRESPMPSASTLI